MAKAKRAGRYGGKIKRNKYDGYTFDSKREMLRYMELKLAERAKVIEDIVVHPRIRIVIGGVPIKYDTKQGPRQMFYVADFRYYDREKGRMVWEDVKMQSGHRTRVYRIKRALVRAMGIEILET